MNDLKELPGPLAWLEPWNVLPRETRNEEHDEEQVQEPVETT